MSTSGRELPAPSRLHPAWVLLACAVPLVGALAGCVLSKKPVIAAGLLGGGALGLAMIRRPDVATLVVIGLLYANVPVVAVKFHGIPTLVGAAVPLLLGLPLVHRLVMRREPVVIGPALPLAFVFLLVQGVGTILAERPESALESLVTFVLEGFALYVLVTNLIRTPQMVRGATWALLGAAVVMGGVPLFQQVTGTFENDYGGFAQSEEKGFKTGEQTVTGDVTQRRHAGPVGEKNFYAQFMLMLVPLGVYHTLNQTHPAARLAALLCTALAGVGCALAFSRGAAVAFALTGLVAWGLGYVTRRQIVTAGLAAAAALACMPQYWTRLASIASAGTVVSAGRNAQADLAVKGRVTEMAAAALVFLDHPFVGVGPGQFVYYAQEYGERVGVKALEDKRQAHSLYLGLAAEHGVLGLIAFSLLIAVSLRQLERARRAAIAKDPELARLATGYLLALVIFLTSGLFLHFAYVRYFWLMLALADAVGLVISSRTARHPSGSSVYAAAP